MADWVDHVRCLPGRLLGCDLDEGTRMVAATGAHSRAVRGGRRRAVGVEAGTGMGEVGREDGMGRLEL